ncbi:hypothetical protein PV04_10459 [Phialophora macrospora]|uniref:Enoyl reductase (ER) domain-containing protein n=1 Tax=Phialophora macrospora TaxID=1851006 RepID=A0A0D2DIR7_9EURO|nr:hypothetical protein PV04_10459 [Phialophora macrospora]
MEEGSQTPLLKVRAWTHDTTGPPEKVLSLHNSLPRPHFGSGTQVLVRVKYAALNPAGSVMMQLCPSFLRAKPSIPEMDFAGQIVEVGVDADPSGGLKPGVEVFGSIPVSDHLKGQGSLSDYVILDACYVAIVPKGVDMQGAAGLPIAGCTALCLMEQAHLQPGQKILVNGAAGGIGSLVTQMVRYAIGTEGRLVAVCSRDKERFARDLGAEEVIDHRTQIPVHKLLAEKYCGDKFDTIIDAYGVQSLFDNCAAFLKESGSYVTVGIAFEHYTYGSMLVAVSRMLRNVLWPRLLGGTPRRYVQVTSACTFDGLQKLKELCEEGKLKVPIDSIWDFNDVPNAYDRMLSRRARGKVVVKVC